MDLKLKGKTALITGGSEGIGKGIALALAKEGVDIAICARRKEPLEAAAGEIAKTTGRKIIAIPADLRQDKDARSFVEQGHKALGRVDIMVNNAGSAPGGVIEHLSEADWAQSLHYIGTQATVDFLASMFGRELMQASRRNPRLLLQHLANGYSTAVSYGERSVLWTGDRSARFVMRRDFMPAPYHEGVLLGALEAVGAQDVRVHGRQLSLLDSEYDVSW